MVVLCEEEQSNKQKASKHGARSQPDNPPRAEESAPRFDVSGSLTLLRQ